jgi:hypothetical protein
MKKKIILSTLLIGIIIGTAACTSTSATAPTPTVDIVSTLALMEAYVIQTQTARAASPTPSITPTPSETPTPTEEITSPEPTTPIRRPVVTAFAPCRRGPGPEYVHVTNIAAKKYVTFVGVGSIPGWYIVREPYFRNICWIEAIYIKLDPRMDVSSFPVMTPIPLPSTPSK